MVHYITQSKPLMNLDCTLWLLSIFIFPGNMEILYFFSLASIMGGVEKQYFHQRNLGSEVIRPQICV